MTAKQNTTPTTPTLDELIREWEALLPKGHDASGTEAILRELPPAHAASLLRAAVARLSGASR